MVRFNKAKTAFKLAERLNVRRWALGLVTFVSLMAILVFNLIPTTIDLQSGQVSKRDVAAPRTVVDKPKTQALQKEARRRSLREASNSLENYEVDQTIAVRAEESISNLFSLVDAKRSTLGTKTAGTPVRSDSQLLKEMTVSLRMELRRYEGIDLLNRTATTLLMASQVTLETMEQESTNILVEILRDTRVSETNVAQVKENAIRRIDNLGMTEPAMAALRDIIPSLIKPNLVLSMDKVRRMEESAVRSVNPVMVLKGQTIVRRGEVVTPEQEELLRDLGLQKRHGNYAGLLGVAILVSGILGLGLFYLRIYHRAILAREEHVALLAMLFVVTAFLAKLLGSFQYIAMGYVIPVPFAAMLVTVLLDGRLAVIFTAASAVVVGILTDFELKFAVIALVGGIVGVLSLSQVHQRSDLTRAGLLIGIVNFLAACSLGLLSGDFLLTTLAAGGLASLNGVISAILTIGSLPFIEAFFGIASAIKLAELSNPTQTLLKRLLVEAPGTYHHSIIVGNLAEAAAEAIGADYVLARVGAQYHDIGKLKRPYFFVENQFTNENPHDKISPSLSTVIITSHVKDGVELAEQHKLPGSVIDFIRQHHGTSLVTFFYHRAVEANSGEEVSEAQFRYAGPRPATKETAIVMLADSVEAAVRSLPQPSPQKVEALIRKIVRERLNDGQLDVCDLTLKDLDTICDVFLKVLSGIFHSRVEYPELPVAQTSNTP